MFTSTWASGLNARVELLAKQALAPGIALAVAENGEPAYFQGFGYRDVARKLPVTMETVFGIASVTKSFTCLAVMQLADGGKLAVTDPVVRWLPEFRVPNRDWQSQITLHHLMSHSSGLPGLPCLFGARAGSIRRDPNAHRLGLALDPAAAPKVESYEDLLRVMAQTKYALLGAPGTRFNYSNEGYALLQGIIERASGHDYLSYMQENILDPIGMPSSTFLADHLKRFPEVTELYAPELASNGQKTVFHAPVWWDVARIYANGSLKSSARDLLRYLEIYRTGGLVEGRRIVSAAAIRQMTTPHVRLPSGTYYGYGLNVEAADHGLTVIHHGGSIKGVSSHVAVVPERNLTVAALVNLTGVNSEQIAYAAIESAARLAPGALAPDYPHCDAEPVAAVEYIGTYRSLEGGQARVLAVGAALAVETEGLRFPVRLFGPDAFVAHGGEKSFHFLRGSSGKVEALFTGVRVLRRENEE